MDEQDSEDLPHVSGESLTNEDLQKLKEQGIHVELENSDSENEESKELAVSFLSKSLVGWKSLIKL